MSGQQIELDTPTIARVMPMKIKRRSSFSATNATQGSKALYPVQGKITAYQIQ
jgi:hypothetical protein